MQNDWILDVIADLRRFAEQNHMPRLAAELERSSNAAVLELEFASLRPSTRGVTADAKDGGAVSGRTAAGQDA